MIKRYLFNYIQDDIEEKILLLSGPRQAGKTTLSKQYFPQSQIYLNYDASSNRKVIREKSWSRDKELLILDEIHKMPKWKTWLKGIYDTEGLRPRLFITGSARLDVYKKGGDSLAGRHFHFRLHPFSVAELKDDFLPQEALSRILKFGGFPEPFTKNSEIAAARWRRSHIDRILREDLLDLENVRNIKQIEVLVDLLAERVGSPISYSSLARDLEISPHTVKKWVQILESLYIIFVVTPYSKNIARSLLHEPKIYFYDTGAVTSGEGGKFENAVAAALLKQTHFFQDALGEKHQLHYLRDKEKREVDFVVVNGKNIELLIEAKLSDENLSPSLKYFAERLSPKQSVQIVYNLPTEKQFDSIKIVSAAEWLAKLV